MKLSVSAEKDKTMSPNLSQTTQLSDFERTFKPFSVKKGAELAPVNWFRDAHKMGTLRKGKNSSSHHEEGDVIVIDDDEDVKMEEDVEMTDLTAPLEQPRLNEMTVDGVFVHLPFLRARPIGTDDIPERLQDVLSSLTSTYGLHRRPQHSEFKSYHPFPVRTILMQLNEAEIAGDDDAVRHLLALLRDRTRLPAKVLVFSEDARPGYFGTWTRNSREVGPRSPFARDVVALDYGYDSGEEWEEESGEADDVVDDDEDDGAATEEVDSDLDDWLVDDDDAEPGTPIEERAGSPDAFDFDLPPPVPKKRVAEPEPKLNKKRKVVVPLVPFSKGPCWENVIGQCEYEPFNGYRIQMFNGMSSLENYVT